MKLFIFILTLIHLQSMATNYEKISQEFLYAVKVGDSYDLLMQELEEVSWEELQSKLATENQQKSFWINIYNAYIQIKAKENPEWIMKKRNRFFSKNWIRIAQKDISFDLIEHGILRKSNWKYGFGYIKKWIRNKYERTFRLNEVDYRIHFALNCGAKACPPIAFYSSEHLDDQLELAASSFLSLNTYYDKIKNHVEVSQILSWFKGDFGGSKGILVILKKHQLISEDSHPKIRYTPYDWTLSLSNYVQ